jgi:hypothetical protein
MSAMSSQVSSSTALPLAHVLLRILIVLNWIAGAGILLLLVAMPTRAWIMSSLDLSPGPDADFVITGLRSIAVFGLLATPLHFIVLKRLLAIVETVRAGDPFVATNAQRLQAIAWALLALEVFSIVIGAIGDRVSAVAPQFDVDAGFSLAGWLAVLLTFLLARVFAAGAMMRDDLEGTV